MSSGKCRPFCLSLNVLPTWLLLYVPRCTCYMAYLATRPRCRHDCTRPLWVSMNHSRICLRRGKLALTSVCGPHSQSPVLVRMARRHARRKVGEMLVILWFHCSSWWLSARLWYLLCVLRSCSFALICCKKKGLQYVLSFSASTVAYIDGLVQNDSISSALAMELHVLQSCTKPIYC